MDSSIIDNQSKVSAFNKLICFLYKYDLRLSKINKIGEFFNQFLSFLYDCMPCFSQFLNIDKLLKNDNVSQLGMGRNPITPWYSDTTKCEHFFNRKDYKRCKKSQNILMLIKVMQVLIILKSWIFDPELELKNTESAIRNKLKPGIH